MTTPHNIKFDPDLLTVYETFVKVMIMEMDIDKINGLVVPDITGFGTTIDEKINGLAECRKLVEKQIKESKNAAFTFDRQHLNKRILAAGQAAIIVEEGDIKLELAEGTVQFPFRISTSLDKIDGQWKVVHWHGSTPVMSENDTWHINDWKKKNQELEIKVAQKTSELEASLTTLKATQEQLILQEKLASLGQLAAGIAHEIKNPMNFVNNFSELSIEYVAEIQDEIAKLESNPIIEEIRNLLLEVDDNLKKIHQHGTRADNIVRSMLMHSRGGSGTMEPTALNELIKEYVNLAFHGMRAGKTAINVKVDLQLDESVGNVDLNPEDFSRVILNLCKNAFDAMRQKMMGSVGTDYLPHLKVFSASKGSKVLIALEDNGPGVSEENRNKLFQPFFTTKKGTEGTGLGLSITHGIIKSHQGEIAVVTEENKYTRFEIEIPKSHKPTKK